MLETAIETAFDGIGRHLDGKGSMIEKANTVTWTSAPSTCLDFVEVGGRLLLELVKVCPTTLVNGKQLDTALLACQRTRSITSNSDLTAADAERVSLKLRQMMSKLRRLTDHSEFLNAFQVCLEGYSGTFSLSTIIDVFFATVFLSWVQVFTYEVRKDFQNRQRDATEYVDADHAARNL